MWSLTVDFRHAVRNLRNTPALAIVAIASIALGIGANVTVFSVVREMILDDLSARSPDRLARVEGLDASYTVYRQLRAAGAFEDLAFYRGFGDRIWRTGNRSDMIWQTDDQRQFFRRARRPCLCRAALFASRRRPRARRLELRLLAQTSPRRSECPRTAHRLGRKALHARRHSSTGVSQHLRTWSVARVVPLRSRQDRSARPSLRPVRSPAWQCVFRANASGLRSRRGEDERAGARRAA